jgi:hypothetical protein
MFNQSSVLPQDAPQDKWPGNTTVFTGTSQDTIRSGSLMGGLLKEISTSAVSNFSQAVKKLQTPQLLTMFAGDNNHESSYFLFGEVPHENYWPYPNSVDGLNSPRTSTNSIAKTSWDEKDKTTPRIVVAIKGSDWNGALTKFDSDVKELRKRFNLNLNDKVIILKEPSKEQLAKAFTQVKAFQEKNPNAEALVYTAAHGTTETDEAGKAKFGAGLTKEQEALDGSKIGTIILNSKDGYDTYS